MPKGPKGQKRPADVVGNAIRVAKIATGEEVDGPFLRVSCMHHRGTEDTQK